MAHKISDFEVYYDDQSGDGGEIFHMCYWFVWNQLMRIRC